MSEFLKPHAQLRMHKVNDVARNRAIRLYRSGPEEWSLQLRAPLGVGGFGMRDGKDFVVAAAGCTIDDLRQLRDAIDAQIKDASEKD